MDISAIWAELFLSLLSLALVGL